MKEAVSQEKNEQLSESLCSARVQLADVETRLKTAVLQVKEMESELEQASGRLESEKKRVVQGRVAATDLLETFDLYWRRKETLVAAQILAQRLAWTQVYLSGVL